MEKPSYVVDKLVSEGKVVKVEQNGPWRPWGRWKIVSTISLVREDGVVGKIVDLEYGYDNWGNRKFMKYKKEFPRQ